MRKFLIATLALLLVEGIAFAQIHDDGKQGRSGKQKQSVIMKLDLTDDQIEKARSIRHDMKKRMIQLRSKRDLIRLDFDEELQKEKPSESKLKKLVEDASKLAAEKTRIRLETKMKITGILTYAQKKELAKQRFSEPRGGRNQRHGRDSGRRGPSSGEGRPDREDF